MKPAAAPILLVEDTPSLLMLYRALLVSAGYSVIVAQTADEALIKFQAAGITTVLLDLVLPDRDGLDLMRMLLELRPQTHVIVMTAHGSIARAVEAMRAGAQEFLVKPFEKARFLDAVSNAYAPTKPAKSKAAPAPSIGAFIGSSDAMARVHAQIQAVARSMATVFITGESGTGKELCAEAIHIGSARASGPFIALNCGAIPQDLHESEVFGHIKGSFAGAISDKQGAAAAADGGTLFLDEICEMDPALQSKLLRFLQTANVMPVGATRPRHVNVRIICATNRDPMDAVRRGDIREDLFYRLFVVPIHMPPLRDRGTDILEIAENALTRCAAEEQKQFFGFDRAVTSLFRSLSWPGNVRQLQNVVRNVVVLNDGGLVTLDMLPESLADQSDRQSALTAPPAPPPDLGALVGLPLAEAERRIITATLALHKGSIPKAARMLELSPSTLYRKIEGWRSP